MPAARARGGAFINLELEGKVAVVTGASKGIGLAITRALVEEGARVVAGARTTDSLDGSTASRPSRSTWLHPTGPARLVAARARRARAASTCWSTTSAPCACGCEGFLGTSDEEFEWAMQMNFFTALRATRAALAADAEAGRGRDRQRRLGERLLSARRRHHRLRRRQGRAVNLTKSLAQEFGPRGIRVNAVSPGPVSTDLWLGKDGVADTVAKATGVDPDTARKNVVASIGGFATGRFTTPEEVATLVVLLASERTANVTGANYVIDGGLIKTT